MNGERQMLPVHTIRIRASSPMAKILSARGRDRGDGGEGHGIDRSLLPLDAPCLPTDRARPRIRRQTSSSLHLTERPMCGHRDQSMLSRRRHVREGGG